MFQFSKHVKISKTLILKSILVETSIFFLSYIDFCFCFFFSPGGRRYFQQLIVMSKRYIHWRGNKILLLFLCCEGEWGEENITWNSKILKISWKLAHWVSIMRIMWIWVYWNLEKSSFKWGNSSTGKAIQRHRKPLPTEWKSKGNSRGNFLKYIWIKNIVSYFKECSPLRIAGVLPNPHT